MCSQNRDWNFMVVARLRVYHFTYPLVLGHHWTDRRFSHRETPILQKSIVNSNYLTLKMLHLSIPYLHCFSKKSLLQRKNKCRKLLLLLLHNTRVTPVHRKNDGPKRRLCFFLSFSGFNNMIHPFFQENVSQILHKINVIF